MTTTLFVAAVLAVFATFAGALTYANFSTRGIVAPGGRMLD